MGPCSYDHRHRVRDESFRRDLNWFRANPEVSKNEWVLHIRQETRARTVISQRSRAISRPGESRLTTEYPANGSFSNALTQRFSRAWSIQGRDPGVVDRNYGQASRLISIGKLNVSPRLHTRPMYLVIFQEPLGALRLGRSHLVEGFTLRCLQRFSLPDVATRRCRWRDNRYTRGPSNPVLSY